MDHGWMLGGLVVLAGGLGVWGAMRRGTPATRHLELRARVTGLRADHARLAEATRRLAREGGPPPLLAELALEADALADELDFADQALAQGDAAEAGVILTGVERRIAGWTAELAAASDALAGGDARRTALAQRVEVARSRLARLRGRAVGEDGLAMLGERLAEAERRAAQDPLAAIAIADAVLRALDRLERRGLIATR